MNIEHRQSMRAALARVRCPADDVEDIMQDALVKYERYSSTVTAGKERSYICMVAVRLALSMYRRRSVGIRVRAEMAPRTSTKPSPDISIGVRAVLTEMSARDREIIMLVDYRGCSHSEAANVLGISPAASKAALCRARATFRKIWGER